MLEGKRISELEVTNEINNGCCFPLLSGGRTKRITYGNLVSKIIGELPESQIEQVKEDVAELETETENNSNSINQLNQNINTINENIENVERTVDGQNATIQAYGDKVDTIEQIIEDVHFEDVLALEQQVATNTENIATNTENIATNTENIATNTENITQEITDRINAITTAINALDVASVGSNGGYIKTISETNGKISATRQAFDTSITSSASNNNAPTSKAVKTYVDTYASLPVGFVYVQFPGQGEPGALGFLGTWSKVTDLNGAYFRATKTGLSYGTTQSEQVPNITGKLDASSTNAAGQFLTDADNSTLSVTGAFSVTRSSRYSIYNGSTTGSFPDTLSFDANKSNSKYVDNGEVRPYTKVIQIWKRTA